MQTGIDWYKEREVRSDVIFYRVDWAKRGNTTQLAGCMYTGVMKEEKRGKRELRTQKSGGR